MPNNHSNASVSEGDALPNRICPMCRNRKNRLQLKLVLRVALARKYNLNPNLKHKKVVHDLLFRPRSLSAVLFRDLTFYNKPIEGMKFFKRLEAQLRLTHSTRDFWVPAPTIKNHFQRKVVNGWAIARKALKQEMIQKKQKKKE
jgi:hypothetical protein